MAEIESSVSVAHGPEGSSDAVASLRSIAGPSLASSSELSSDGKTLTLTLPSGTVSLDAAANHAVAHGGKSFSYSLGSLYLQIVNPDQSLLQYRQACKKYGISDGVKATDKAAVIGFFTGSSDAGAGRKSDDDMDIDDDDRAKSDASERRKDDEGSRRSSDRDRDRDRHRDRDRDDRHRRDKDKHRDRDRHHREKDRRHSSDRHHKDRDHHHKHREDKDRRHSSDRHHKDKHDHHRHHKDKHGRDRHHHKHKHDKHHRHHKDKHRDRDHDDHDEKRSKKSKAPITHEQLMEHLDTVVGKRTAPGKKISDDAPDASQAPEEAAEAAAGEGAKGAEEKRAATPGLSPADEEEQDEAALLKQCLSSAGFEVRNLTSEIEADRPAVERITAAEIPVGDSASVLRCGAAGTTDSKRDFGRVLDLYNEVLKADEAAKKAGRGTPGSKRGAPPPPGSDSKRSRIGQAAGGAGGEGGTAKPAGKPIIVVPNAMTSPITMINARQFFQDRLFVPRDVAMRQSGRKRPPSISVKRRVAPRLGGGEVEYEIVDNPTTRLQRSAEWDRVVAVLAQGASWQFKGWKLSQPVDIFSRSYGFYIGMEGAPVPGEIKGWNVKIGTLNRDKRGLDQVTSASFWNGLDEWMSVHKPQYLPSAD